MAVHVQFLNLNHLTAFYFAFMQARVAANW